jgi:hypothetical protein
MNGEVKNSIIRIVMIVALASGNKACNHFDLWHTLDTVEVKTSMENADVTAGPVIAIVMDVLCTMLLSSLDWNVRKERSGKRVY